MASLKFIATLALLTTHCGDPQLDEQVRGIPLFSIRGSTQMTGMVPEGPLRIALFWSPQGPRVTDAKQFIEQLGTSVPLEVPSNYVLNIFELPSPEHMLRRSDGSEAGYAVGRVLVYIDADADGRYTPGELFVGSVGNFGQYYIRDFLTPENTPTHTPLAPNFYTVMLPQPCDFVPPTPTDPGTCGVPLGETCSADSECAGGICKVDDPFPWPSGYCTIPDPSPSGCYPSAAAYVGAPPARAGMRVPPPPKGFYLRPCTVQSDCIRPNERQGFAYRCDPGLRGCIPGAPPFVQVGDALRMPPFCAGSGS